MSALSNKARAEMVARNRAAAQPKVITQPSIEARKAMIAGYAPRPSLEQLEHRLVAACDGAKAALRAAEGSAIYGREKRLTLDEMVRAAVDRAERARLQPSSARRTADGPEDTSVAELARAATAVESILEEIAKERGQASRAEHKIAELTERLEKARERLEAVIQARKPRAGK